MSVRSAAKAILCHDGKILVNKCITEENEVYYDLPGGGQNQFESLETALIREVMEETGYRVKIIRFAALAEEIYDDEELRRKYFEHSHRILHIFIAELEDENASAPTETDLQQQESLWLTPEETDVLSFRPVLSGKLVELINSSFPCYLGCVRMP